MNFSSKKNYFVLILWIIFFGLLICLVVLPFFNGLKKDSHYLLFQKKALTFFEKRIKEFENIEEDYPFYQPIIDKIGTSFVNKEVPIKFIEFLENQAKSANLTIKILPSHIPFTENDPWLSVGFRISSQENFPDCLKFLEKLERSSWLIEILDLNIQKIKEEFSFNLILKVFSNQINEI